MAEYIDREAALKHKRKMQGEDWSGEFWDEAVLCEDIEAIPAADVVEVCRCHECKYGDNNIQKNEIYTVCNRWGNGILKMSPLDYCSYGERKGDCNNCNNHSDEREGGED